MISQTSPSTSAPEVTPPYRRSTPVTSGVRPVTTHQTNDNKTPAQERRDSMTTSSGIKKGQRAPRLSMLKYQIIADSVDFRAGLWRDEAACVSAIRIHPEEYSISDWFPGETHITTKVSPKVAEVCGSCEVRLECLTYAIQTNQPDGIWAGHTRRQIHKMTNKIRRPR